jgi:hypothetical protein
LPRGGASGEGASRLAVAKDKTPKGARGSRFCGVEKASDGGKFFGRGYYKRRAILGAFTDDEELAARVHDCIARILWETISRNKGRIAALNFPEEPFKEQWEAIGGHQRLTILKHMRSKNVPMPKVKEFLNS